LNSHEVADFFYKVGKLDRVVNISDVTMGRPRDQDGKMIMTTSCLATTFRFIDKPIAPADDKKKSAKGKKKRR